MGVGCRAANGAGAALGDGADDIDDDDDEVEPGEIELGDEDESGELSSIFGQSRPSMRLNSSVGL